jgi:class 3 adenylate cyclase/tetratricopeptide (TPR) repeat protein
LPSGERRQLTILFCDLVGSTELSTQLDPEEWRDIVSSYHRVAAENVEKFGGHVAKYLGDGVLALFGYPQAHDDDAERAVRVGLAMVEAVHALKEGLHPSPPPLPEMATEEGTLIPSSASTSASGGGLGRTPLLSVRVGIHTGLTVIADAGGKADVFGDTPNIAARVQSAAEPDTVVITAATQRLVAGLFVVEDRGAQRLKGVPEPVVLYRVVQPSGVRSRLDVSAGRHTPFVGRQTEIGVLGDAWERVVEGLGQTVLVQGEAGLGKSRLCYQLREQLSGEPHTWLECRCSLYTSGTAFRPITELVEQALAFQPTDTPSEKLAKLGTGLTRVGFAADEAVPLLAEWLELPQHAGYAPLQMGPDLKRRKTLETLAAWSLKLGELQPMVVLVEDLHWCDPSSLELLGRLVAQSATAHVLLVGTARPEFANPWPARSNLQTVTLGRLTKRQMREMIAAASTTRALPEAVMAQLVTRADGIPLFAEELTQAVVEAGGDAAVAAIPVTLQDSLLARLDRLSSAKEVAQRAAVLGREFSYALVAATAGLEDATLQQGLARLVEAELVFVRGVPPEATYTFKHALVQEAAYESLLKRTRQQLHGRVVDVLMAEVPERAAAAPEVVARHAELAGRIDDAITYHQHAGEQAQARSAHTEAIGHLRHAIALLATRPGGGERDSREVALQLALAGSLRPARGFAHPECEAAYERARVLCETAGDARRLGLALGGLASACSNRGEIERGRTLAARLLTVAEQSGDRELALLGNAELAVAEYWQGKFASALARGEAGRSLYEAGRHDALVSTFGGDPGVIPQSYGDPGLIALCFAAFSLWNLGWSDRALARVREMVELSHHLRDPFNLAYALFVETFVHCLRRDATAQSERAGEVIALSEANTFPLFMGAGRGFHAATRVAAGDTGAVADLLAGLAIVAETGNQAGAPGIFALLAEAYMAAGQLAEARGAVETGLAVAAQTGQLYFDADLHRLQGEILIADWRLRNAEFPSPNPQSEIRNPQLEAEECFHRALDIARAQEAKALELRAATSLARLWREQDKREAARDLLAPLYAWFTEGFDTRDLIEAKALLDELS